MLDTRIDYGGNTNAHNASSIQYGASRIKSDSITGSYDCVHLTVVIM